MEALRRQKNEKACELIKYIFISHKREVNQIGFQVCISLQLIPFHLVNFYCTLDVLYGAQCSLFPGGFLVWLFWFF